MLILKIIGHILAISTLIMGQIIYWMSHASAGIPGQVIFWLAWIFIAVIEGLYIALDLRKK